jgi:hypothetical protein
MHLELKNDNEVIITGNIKSVEDSLLVKNTISDILTRGSRSIHLKIMDSLSMTSTMIGFLMKIVHQEKIHLLITVGDSRLYSLLEELNLVQQFNVHLIEH